jgi:hypothetical protein
MWLTFMTMSRISTAWLKHHRQNRTVSWDFALYKLMSIVLIISLVCRGDVVLITSLACRGDDVARSRSYSGTEYLQYHHLHLVLEDEVSLLNLRAQVTLEYPKDYKDV